MLPGFNFEKILLASGSPRRSYLLDQAALPFRQVVPKVDEIYPREMDVYKVPLYLAEKKAIACLDLLENNEILLASDSVVILNGKILEKPKDRSQAEEFLRDMSGQMHEVITGVCLATKIKRTTFSGYTKVFFNEILDDQIKYYLDQFKPYDKAGSYGIQDWIGWTRIAKIEGSYSNVMGLPVAMLYEELVKF